MYSKYVEKSDLLIAFFTWIPANDYATFVQNLSLK